MAVYVSGVGLAAPGLLTWESSQLILAGQLAYEAIPLEKYKPTQLPPNEARRATELVRMAFRVGEDLMRNTTVPMNECASVFGSSGGDYPIIDQICRTLCEPERLVSPTQFHNSVHNSAAGYWSIATGSRLPSTSLSAYDDSFSVGLLEAITLCQSEQMPTLLVVYDIKPPYPLSEKRRIPVEFGVALLLMPSANDQAIAKVEISVAANQVATPCVTPALESLRLANPAARALPLLELLALKNSGRVVFDNSNQQSLVLEVSKCQ